MSWILIITLVASVYGGRSSSIAVVPGFATAAACKVAGDAVLARHADSAAAVRTVCVRNALP